MSAPGHWLGSLFGGAGGHCTLASDHCFDTFVSPVTNPFFFEDPRAVTEVRPIFIHQHAPGDNALFHGGNIEFFALQGRIAFNERFSLVLHKLGFIMTRPDGGQDESGLSELQIGPKYTFYRDDSTNTVAAIGLNFEIPVGNHDVFQDTGSGSITPYLTAGQKFGNFHVLGAAGYRWSIDDDRSDSLFVSLHGDYSFFDRIYPLLELNYYHYTQDGSQTTAHFEGQDLINFGSTNVSGNDIVTLAAGVRFKITESVQAGIAYETPITNREDLMDFRITADLIFRF